MRKTPSTCQVRNARPYRVPPLLPPPFGLVNAISYLRRDSRPRHQVLLRRNTRLLPPCRAQNGVVKAVHNRASPPPGAPRSSSALPLFPPPQSRKKLNQEACTLPFRVSRKCQERVTKTSSEHLLITRGLGEQETLLEQRRSEGSRTLLNGREKLRSSPIMPLQYLVNSPSVPNVKVQHSLPARSLAQEIITLILGSYPPRFNRICRVCATESQSSTLRRTAPEQRSHTLYA